MLQTTFLLPKVLPLVKISAKLGHILGSKTPKTSQKGPFHICLIDTQKKKYILTTANAILAKHTMVVYLHGESKLKTS